MLLLVALVLTIIISFLLLRVAPRLGLLDHPDQRKKHSGIIPLVGGLSFYGASAGVLMFAYSDEPLIAGYLLSVTLITLMGAVDDSQGLGIFVRLFVQMLAALVLVFSSGHSIQTFFTMFSGDFFAISATAGTILTIFAVMGAINAFNMVDGVDGLAGLLALNTFCSMALLFWLSGQVAWVLWPLVISSALFGFLLFNSQLSKHFPKVFMGDAGALFIGFSIIYLLIIGSQSGGSPAFKTVTALWIIAIPLTDMAAIILERIKRRQSAFAADRQHLHHLLLRVGFSSKQVTLLLAFFAVGYSSIGVFGEYYHWPDYFMFYGFLLNFAFHIYLRFSLSVFIEKRSAASQ